MSENNISKVECGNAADNKQDEAMCGADTCTATIDNTVSGPSSDMLTGEDKPVNSGSAPEEKKPGILSNFQEHWPFIKNVLDVLTLVILAFTLFVTATTISEMRKDRNESYKAVIAANPVKETMAIKKSLYSHDSSYMLSHIAPPSDYDNYVTGYALPSNSYQDQDVYQIRNISTFSMSKDPEPTSIKFADIGPGIATKVKFIWNDENVKTLYESLLEVNDKASEYLIIRDQMVVGYYILEYFPAWHYQDLGTYHTRDEKLTWLSFQSPDITEYSYIVSNYEETYEVGMPLSYSILFAEILTHEYDAKPSVKLTVEFTDTQGIDYSELITLTASNPSEENLQVLDDDGNIVVDAGGQPYYQDGITYTITADHSTPVRK